VSGDVATEPSPDTWNDAPIPDATQSATRFRGGAADQREWEAAIAGFRSDLEAEQWLRRFGCSAFLNLEGIRVRLDLQMSDLGSTYSLTVQRLLEMAWAFWRRGLVSLDDLIAIWSMAAGIRGARASRADGEDLTLEQGAAISARLHSPEAVTATVALRCRAAIRPWAPGSLMLWRRFTNELSHRRIDETDLVSAPLGTYFSADDLKQWFDLPTLTRLKLVRRLLHNPLSYLVADGMKPAASPSNFGQPKLVPWVTLRQIGSLSTEEMHAVSLALLLQCQDRMNDGIVDRLVTCLASNERDAARQMIVQTLQLARLTYDQFPATAEINHPISQLMDTGPWLSSSSIPWSCAYAAQRSPYSLTLGALSNTQDLHFVGDQSLITIAPPGAGKTRSFVMPNLWHYRGSMIVLDVKGECYAATAEHRRSFSDVFLFAPEVPDETGHRFNPLQFLSRDPGDMIEDARILADAIVTPSSAEARFFDDRARDLLVSILVLLLEREHRTGVTPTLAAVHQTARMGGAELAIVLEEMANSAMPALQERAAELISMIGGLSGGDQDGAQRTVLNIFETLRQHLSAFEGERVRQITSGVSSWDPADLRDRPITVYIRVSPTAIKSLAPVLRLIIASNLHRLMPAGRAAAAPGRVPVLAVLDELPQLGAMSQIETAVHVGRSYGLTSWLFAQHTGQLEHAYGPERARALINACGVQIWMNPIAEDAHRLSDLLGFIDEDTRIPTRRLATVRSLTGPDYRDQAIVKAVGEKPARVKKSYWRT
jgi:Type IV secretory system Conjugative DNA transfer